MKTSAAAIYATSPSPLYPRLLGPAWAGLDEALRQAHLDGERLCLSGTFCVRVGTGLGARIAGLLLRLPAAGDAVATRLTVVRTNNGESWTRSFANSKMTKSQMTTRQTAHADGTMRERFSIIEIACRLEADGKTICYHQVGASLRFGPVRIPLPRRLWPLVVGTEAAHGPGQTRVSVRVTMPLVGHLISYDGIVTRERDTTQESGI
jgi:hypothetical protein